MIYIDKYAYICALKHIKPEFKLLFGLSALVAAVCSTAVLCYVFILVVMSWAVVIKAKIPFTYYLKLMSICVSFLVFGVLGVIINISYDYNPLSIWVLTLGEIYVSITGAGLKLALLLALKSFSAVSCLYFIILTTPVRDIIYFLHKIKCPPLILTLTTMIYRFIFLLMDIAYIKVKSQQARHGYDSAKNFKRTFGMLWGSVFIQSFIASEWVYKAMAARGHDKHIKFLQRDTNLNAKDIAVVAVFLAVVIALNFVNLEGLYG